MRDVGCHSRSASNLFSAFGMCDQVLVKRALLQDPSTGRIVWEQVTGGHLSEMPSPPSAQSDTVVGVHQSGIVH